MSINSVFDQLVELSFLSDKVYPDPRFPPSSYYRFMRRLAEWKKPSMSVELGVCGGGASLHLALGWSGGDVLGIDHALEYPDNITYIKLECPNFYFWRRDAVESAVEFDTVFLGRRVDILFIDTVHTYESTMAEFNAWRRHLIAGSVVLLDDLFRPGMDLAWLELSGLATFSARYDHLHIGGEPTDGGFGVLVI